MHTHNRTHIKTLSRAHPSQSGIMERGNFAAAAGFGMEKVGGMREWRLPARWLCVCRVEDGDGGGDGDGGDGGSGGASVVIVRCGEQ